MVQGATGARTRVGSTVSDKKEEGAAGLVSSDGEVTGSEAATSSLGLRVGGEWTQNAGRRDPEGRREGSVWTWGV